MSLADHLLAGDILLYKPRGFFGFIISLKTWNPIAHCESYIGFGQCVASRDGQGVNTYSLRTTDLAMVLRPKVPFSQNAALAWFLTKAKGQGYDWVGLLRFAWRAKVVPDAVDNKQFCSEFLTRYYRAGGVDFFPGGDADAVAPCAFATNPLLQRTEIHTLAGV